MDAIGQARMLFRKHQDHKFSLSECDQNQLEADIKRFIYIGIKEITPAVKLFVFSQILDVLTHVLKMRALDNMDIRAVSKAFDNLESYFILLVEQPWKPEFKKLKMYGGFYKTKIKSVLSEPEPIFKLAGYELDKDKHLLVIKKPVQKDSLLSIAFDCRVANSLCRTIMQHYNKLKSLNKTLGDAISDVLHDPSFSSLSSYAPKSINILKGSGIVRPPAIPKREPHVNGLSDVKLPPSLSVKVKSPSKNARRDPLLPNYSQHQINAVSRISSNPPSAGVDENLLCIGDTNSEILPVLPEGTSEDHMRESLKMLDRQKSSKHLEGTTSEPSSRHVLTYEDLACYEQPDYTVDVASRCPALTFPPGFQHSHTRNPVPYMVTNPPSIDEGIGPEMSTMIRPSTRYLPSGHSQLVPPNKAPTSFPQPSMTDYGYRSENVNDPTGTTGWSRTIHLPPDVDTDGHHNGDPLRLGIQVRPGSQMVGNQNFSFVGQAPLIPPRALKPHFRPSNRIQGEEEFDGRPLDSHPAVEAVANVNHNSVSIRPTHSLQVQMNGQVTNESGGGSNQAFPDFHMDEANLRRSRISSTGRSGSLKTGEPKSPLAQVAAQSRVTRSMDFTHTQWECQMCTTRNVASDNVCAMCARSRHRQVDTGSVTRESRIPCHACTFENDPDERRCEMCNSELKPFSFT